MSYHRFPNLREMLQGNLISKLNHFIVSEDFKDRPCNCCRKLRQNNGKCIYNSKCRRSLLVYKATCTDGHYYIGSTQQHLKSRMNSHFGEVRDLINRKKGADTFARHCANQLKEKERISAEDARKCVEKVEILWQGNPLSCVKSFKSLTCKLCMKERLLLYKARLKEKDDETNLLINTGSEIYGACRHIPRFHRYQRYDPSTDEGHDPEKVAGE